MNGLVDKLLREFGRTGDERPTHERADKEVSHSLASPTPFRDFAAFDCRPEHTVYILSPGPNKDLTKVLSDSRKGPRSLQNAQKSLPHKG